jgi:hypothetical protein
MEAGRDGEVPADETRRAGDRARYIEVLGVDGRAGARSTTRCSRLRLGRRARDGKAWG